MVLEAVPCMFQSNQEGRPAERRFVGLLIRSSNDTASTSASGPRTTSVTIPGGASTSSPIPLSSPIATTSSVFPSTSKPMTPTTGPLLVQGYHPNGTPIVVNSVNGDAPKILVPANIQVRLQKSSSAPTYSNPASSTPTASFTTAPWQIPPNAKSIPITTGSFASPSMSSPCSSQPRSISVCSASPLTDTSPMSPNPVGYPYSSSAHISQMNGNQVNRYPIMNGRGASTSNSGTAPINSDSSTTPDSGIQSVPTSPPDSQELSPPNMEPCDSVCEAEGNTDFDDMPRLLPADQEAEDDIPSSSNFPPALREDGLSHGSECETTPAPTISITRTMDSDEIVDKLIELAPDKISLIANLIKKKTTQQRKRKSNSATNLLQQDIPNTEPAVKRKRKGSVEADQLKSKSKRTKIPSPDLDLVKTEVKQKKKRESTKTSSKLEKIEKKEKEEVPTETEEADIEYDVKTYRRAMRMMLQDMLLKNVDRITNDIDEMHICGRYEKRSIKDKCKIWSIDWEQVKIRAKKREEQKKKAETDKKAKVMKKQEHRPVGRPRKHPPKPEEGDKKLTTPAVTPRKRGSSESRLRNANETASSCEKKPPEKIDGEVATSFSDGRILHWEAPALRCGCTRGACTSDAECINRALCVQCTSTCDAPLCANKKFWKRDATKSLIAFGPKIRRVLRTKQARRAGEFLCEFAGEVISYDEALKRTEIYSNDTSIPAPPRILCLSSRLFIDATIRSNIARYARHSCRPNSRLEVWIVGGRLRVGIFSLFDIASGAEITIDMDRLLPVERECHCDASNCKKILKVARNAVLANSSPLSSSEKSAIKSNSLFLIRNRRKMIEAASGHGISQSFIENLNVKPCTPAALKQIVNGLLYRMRRIDGSLPYVAIKGHNRVETILREAERRKTLDDSELIEKFRLQVQKWLDEIDDDDLDRVFTALRARYLDNDKEDSKKGVLSQRKRENSKRARPETDLSYLYTKNPVGSYDPDMNAWTINKETKKTTDEDAVRCICGSLEEDGEMLQCDTCHYWLHSECLDDVDQDTDYKCAFCSGTITEPPFVDVPLKKPPEFSWNSCIYYKALINRRSIQIRLNETVYVLRSQGDEHKKILRKLEKHDKKKKGHNDDSDEEDDTEIPPLQEHKYSPAQYERKELRIFRVERLFSAPGGHRFVFGFYYAYPHETYSRDVRQFHKNEVFATPLYDTLPLDFVVGRCVVLDSLIYGKGRPTVPKFKESDVYVCDYQIDRSQKVFEKIPSKDHYPINTQPYVFETFPQKMTVIRDFTPFILADRPITRTPSRLSSAKALENDSPSKNKELQDLRSSHLNSVITKKFPQVTPQKNRPGRKKLSSK